LNKLSPVAGDERLRPEISCDFEMGLLIGLGMGPVRRPREVGSKGRADVDVVHRIGAFDQRKPQMTAKSPGERALVTGRVVAVKREAMGVGAATGEGRRDDR
jgi:hypothetical protein